MKLTGLKVIFTLALGSTLAQASQPPQEQKVQPQPQRPKTLLEYAMKQSNPQILALLQAHLQHGAAIQNIPNGQPSSVQAQPAAKK